MRHLVFLIVFFSVLASAAEAKKVMKLRVDRAALESCQFYGKNRCILAVNRPVLVLFQVGERIKFQNTASDSEVKGIFVFVVERYFDITRQIDPTSIANQPNDYHCRHRAAMEGLCYESGGAKDILIIVPPETSFVAISKTFNGRIPGVLLIPKGPVNSVSEE